MEEAGREGDCEPVGHIGGGPRQPVGVRALPLSDGADGDAADAPWGDTAEGWWREFRDLMEWSGASAAEFEVNWEF